VQFLHHTMKILTLILERKNFSRITFFAGKMIETSQIVHLKVLTNEKRGRRTVVSFSYNGLNIAITEAYSWTHTASQAGPYNHYHGP
jgi:hypothetical protein